MRRSVLLSVVVLAAGLTSGCAHRLTIQAPDGSGGEGSASRGTGSGSIEMVVDGKRYVGRWTAATEGGVGFGTLLSGSRMATANTITVGGSRGIALLRSPEGGTLRCEFVYSGLSAAGFGVCQDGNGKTYDLMIG
ncbi:hypothetical protein WDZ92_39045 [Nostoc sp. NIES-2111]